MLALPQPLPLDESPKPSPIMALISEALDLRSKLLGLISRNATFMDVDGGPFLEGLDVRTDCFKSSKQDQVAINTWLR